MAIIKEEIPQQSFELIRDRIGEILIEELTEQVEKLYQEELLSDVYIERVIPIDKTELSVINVIFAGGKLNAENVKDGNLEYIYNVDVYTNSKSNANADSDKVSALKGQRMLGVCRAILRNSGYRTLGFTPGQVVTRVSIRDISVVENLKQDANSTYMGRLVVAVNAIERTSVLDGLDLQRSTTIYKIAETDKGYKFVKEND
jgi:hypothetical protein